MSAGIDRILAFVTAVDSDMKTLLIAAPASGKGKTTVTMGLLRALRQRGLDVCAYKVGPDYIDPAFLTKAAGNAARNLDLHLQGKAGVRCNLQRGRSDYALIEGVMGYFDGLHNTWRHSSYHLASLFRIPTLLIYTPKGEMFSAIPKIKGMAEFGHSTICGVLFNQVSRHYYGLLKEALEEYTSLKAPGYVPEIQEAGLKSRHLGLVQSIEVDELDRKIDLLAAQIAAHVDLDAVIDMMDEYDPSDLCEELPEFPTVFSPDITKTEVCASLSETPGPAASLPTLLENTSCSEPSETRTVRVAVARDEAFSFYYTENLELLERYCMVSYFSPLRDTQLPDCDLLYMGGGYPELFLQELSENTAMLRAVREYAEAGGCVYAECGGFMYLTESLDGAKMVGIFRGMTKLTTRLQRFGYIDIELKSECLLGKAGTCFTAHEFHRSVSEVQGDTVFRIRKSSGTTSWDCGYRYKNVLAGYPHINFLGHPGILQYMLEYCGRKKLPEEA
ncbi:cobyrinate a,c-diamide synthase [candidate division KSB3 bacterium]|uniref:Cobyrinate a,c-diamide synthase n=1 Tax=candidate division KSB3 bacterium TaxID=2044937 RepID=A0A2G6EAH5_9BACT|nr:MAG: cobyrinate a,c-diamide synthase [candidate division KSB3 bacterium]PIE30903.1 MAG: cobyrinate a,c-diamide synthase [candidate division KSB3 bacterium]